MTRKPAANLMLHGETMVFLRSTRQRYVLCLFHPSTVLKLLAGEIRASKRNKKVRFERKM